MREIDQPVTQTMKATDVRANWSETINQVARRKTRVVVEKAGVPVAAIISAQDWDRLRRYDAEREADFAVLDRMRAAFADVPDEELEREITKAIAEVRAEMRAERAQAARTS
jgi:prevent-host-death family protein